MVKTLTKRKRRKTRTNPVLVSDWNSSWIGTIARHGEPVIISPCGVGVNFSPLVLHLILWSRARGKRAREGGGGWVGGSKEGVTPHPHCLLRVEHFSRVDVCYPVRSFLFMRALFTSPRCRQRLSARCVRCIRHACPSR